MEFPAQWPSLLKNLGTWEGSFATFSIDGKLQSETPTIVSLEGFDNDRTVRQTITRLATDGTVADQQVLQYSSLARSCLVFAEGHFSQGATQYSPLSNFGAEMGFIAGDRRLRLVTLFQDGQSTSLTLIQEQRQGISLPAQPPLTPGQLVGQWTGRGVTLYPDWRSPTEMSTSLTIEQQGQTLKQTIEAPGVHFSSNGTCSSDRTLDFTGNTQRRVILLPGGASANIPLSIPPRTSFFVEAGWLVNDRLRYRMMRQYDAQGTWTSLTWIEEQRSL